MMIFYHINYTSQKTYDNSYAPYSFVAVADMLFFYAEWHGEQYLSVHKHEHEGPAIAAIAVRLNDC